MANSPLFAVHFRLEFGVEELLTASFTLHGFLAAVSTVGVHGESRLQDSLWVVGVHFPVVFLQVVLGDHPFAAQVAAELERFVVHDLVLLHHALRLERLVANVALERSLLRVRLAVLLHVALVGESLLAEVAAEALLSVLLLVHDEVVRHLEALAADVAHAVPVFLVLLRVPLQRLHVVETLLALATFKPV